MMESSGINSTSHAIPNCILSTEEEKHTSQEEIQKAARDDSVPSVLSESPHSVAEINEGTQVELKQGRDGGEEDENLEFCNENATMEKTQNDETTHCNCPMRVKQSIGETEENENSNVMIDDEEVLSTAQNSMALVRSENQEHVECTEGLDQESEILTFISRLLSSCPQHPFFGNTKKFVSCCRYSFRSQNAMEQSVSIEPELESYIPKFFDQNQDICKAEHGMVVCARMAKSLWPEREKLPERDNEEASVKQEIVSEDE